MMSRSSRTSHGTYGSLSSRGRRLSMDLSLKALKEKAQKLGGVGLSGSHASLLETTHSVVKVVEKSVSSAPLKTMLKKGKRATARNKIHVHWEEDFCEIIEVEEIQPEDLGIPNWAEDLNSLDITERVMRLSELYGDLGVTVDLGRQDSAFSDVSHNSGNSGFANDFFASLDMLPAGGSGAPDGSFSMTSCDSDLVMMGFGGASAFGGGGGGGGGEGRKVTWGGMSKGWGGTGQSPTPSTDAWGLSPDTGRTSGDTGPKSWGDAAVPASSQASPSGWGSPYLPEGELEGSEGPELARLGTPTSASTPVGDRWAKFGVEATSRAGSDFDMEAEMRALGMTSEQIDVSMDRGMEYAGQKGLPGMPAEPASMSTIDELAMMGVDPGALPAQFSNVSITDPSTPISDLTSSDATEFTKMSLAEEDDCRVVEWIQTLTGRTKGAGIELSDWLADGSMLCHAVNAIKISSVSKVVSGNQSSNFSAFATACGRLGVAKQDLIDMEAFRLGDMRSVLTCLKALSASSKATCPSFAGPFLSA